MSASLQQIYTNQLMAEATAAFNILPKGSSPDRSNRQLSPRNTGSPDRVKATILAGASDLLRLADSHFLSETDLARRPKEWELVKEYLLSNGDSVIHFSGECAEILGNLPIKRYFILTDKAIYRIPQSTLETGIFFNCRTPLDALTQVVTEDVALPSSSSADVTSPNNSARSPKSSARKWAPSDPSNVILEAHVEFFTKKFQSNASANNKPGETTDLLSAELGGGTPFFILTFGQEFSKRKVMLLALCSVRPGLTILQKRKAVSSEIKGPAPKTASPHISQYTDKPKMEASLHRQQRKGQTPRSTRSTPRVGGGNNKQAGSLDQSSPVVEPLDLSAMQHQDAGGENISYESPSFTYGGLDVSNEEFEHSKDLLRNMLQDNAASSMGDWDQQKASRLPPEEDNTQKKERDNVRAFLEAREAKMLQNIQFRIKYPQKVPTRVPPGVEYDKAHEERMVLPDNIPDDDLLGPSLFSLWRAWKKTGGLSGNSGVPTDWTLYDSQDLIDSLRSREDVLFGLVGRVSLYRLQMMRELVERERQMFMNKQSLYAQKHQREAELESTSASPNDNTTTPGQERRSLSMLSASASPSQARGLHRHKNGGTPTHTIPEPFNLSQSPTTLRKLKIIDSKQLIGEMRKNFDLHLKTMHQLRKDQLERDLHRVSSN